MTLLTWGFACAVGVRAMDDQHGILMDTLNELRMAAVQGRRTDEVHEILDRLIKFSRMHFDNEEKLMEETRFPGLLIHSAEHTRLLAEMLRASRKLKINEKLAMQPLFCKLRNSYIQHIEGPDREYGPWLNARGKV